MKLGYKFKQYDYVVCTDLNEEQITAIVDRMVECGAKLYEDYEYYSNTFNSVVWDIDGETYFDDPIWVESDDRYTEVKWEDIVKTEIKPKTLREMYPNGMYTDNSPEVFERFKELLEGDVNRSDKVAYDDSYQRCGLDAEFGGVLAQFHIVSYGESATYLTNEEFFAIKLGNTTSLESPEDDIRSYGCFQQVANVIGEERALEELGKVEDWNNKERELSSAFIWFRSIQGWRFWNSIDEGGHPDGQDTIPSEVEVVNLDDELGFDLVEDSEEPNHTIGYLIEQIQLNTAPNSPEVIIGKDGSVILYGLDLEINVSGKSADEIDKIYQALCVLMQEV